jgi:hypothetical protein
MSATRNKLNVGALVQMLGRAGGPPRELPQPMQLAAPGAGGGAGARPIDWKSPDDTLSLFAEVDNASTRIRLQDDCGSQILIQITSAGLPMVRVIDCAGNGVKITPEGIQQVTVTDAGGETETETEIDSPYGPITVQACVDGVTKTLHLIGWVEE